MSLSDELSCMLALGMAQGRANMSWCAVMSWCADGSSHVWLQVVGLLVMYGLPRLLTGSILAHECMHAWFVLNYVDCSNKTVNEGLSQLLALMWIEAQKDQVSQTVHPDTTSSACLLFACFSQSFDKHMAAQPKPLSTSKIFTAHQHHTATTTA